MLPAGTSWYCPQTMFLSGNRFSQAVFCLAACLLLVAGSGCSTKPLWFRSEGKPLLEMVKVSELRPGCYCEIEMVVPPTAPEGSFHCYKGTVREINHDEVVLTDLLEETCLEYGAAAHRRSPTQQKREIVRVPLTGVDTIWALPPAKNDATASQATKPSTLKLPSSNAQPVLPPIAASSFTAEKTGSPPAASRFSVPPLPETPAHFDSPLAAGDTAR